ncbi:MAG TPA: DUF4153 domain-containing protein [Allosphingosinicella sp.]|jgi:uncharacterized membrane protein YiaA
MVESTSDRADHGTWPARALYLAVLGAAFGFPFSKLVERPERVLDIAVAAALAVSGVVFALSLERLRWHWSAVFAVFAGSVAGFVGYWNGSPGDWGSDEGWHFASAIAAAVIAVPLFQAARDAGGPRFAPAAVHAHAWTNAILGAVAGAFVGATMLMTVLLSELFALIGLDFLRELMQRGWFLGTLACAALGAAVGLLRDRDAVMDTVQRVVRAILSVLAPLLALGLVFFVLALPFTGLDALWEQTKSTTPILLACVFGAVLLVNAVAGNSLEEEARAPALRWAAIALAAVALPLTVVAAVSTAKRIGQYGFTPDRLWAAVFIAVAAAFALSYLAALLRKRGGWMERVRGFNVRLVAGICLLALFLALPIVSFGALSTRDQLARLESGKVAPDKFDWAALRFDFGPAGRRALDRMAASGAYRTFAAEALKARHRYDLYEPDVATLPPPKVVVDGGAAIAPDLLDAIARTRRCAGTRDRCRVVTPAPEQAVLLSAVCDTCAPSALVFERRPDGRWAQLGARVDETGPEESLDPSVQASGKVEIRTVPKRQVFVDGKPVGEIFD